MFSWLFGKSEEDEPMEVDEDRVNIYLKQAIYPKHGLKVCEEPEELTIEEEPEDECPWNWGDRIT